MHARVVAVGSGKGPIMSQHSCLLHRHHRVATCEEAVVASFAGVVSVRIGSLFSGIGGLELGLEWAGLGPVVWQVEKDEYCRQILSKHWPDVERHSDVRTVGSNLQPADLICGGFPCQDVSSAGSGAGLKGARSGLWYEFRRIVSQLKPAWVVVENVSSGAGRWVDPVRRDLEELGFQTLPVPLSARAVGAPHLRRRVFIIAAHPERERLRQQRQRARGPGGRARGVRAQGNAESSHAGASRCAANPMPIGRGQGGVEQVGDGGCAEGSETKGRGPVPNPDGGRREGQRVEARCGEQGTPGCEPNGRGDSRQNGERPPAWGAHEFWSSGPPVCGVDDGTSTKLDRSRLKALGNAVVPQCAQVIGEVIRVLENNQTGA